MIVQPVVEPMEHYTALVAGLTLVGDDHDGGRVLDDVPDPALGPVGGQGHVGEAGLEQGQQGHHQILGGEEPESSACYLSRIVPQIDPSVPQPVVQSRRRPLLGPSPG